MCDIERQAAGAVGSLVGSAIKSAAPKPIANPTPEQLAFQRMNEHILEEQAKRAATIRGAADATGNSVGYIIQSVVDNICKGQKQ